MSYFAFLARSSISATYFTVIGNVCKARTRARHPDALPAVSPPRPPPPPPPTDRPTPGAHGAHQRLHLGQARHAHRPLLPLRIARLRLLLQAGAAQDSRHRHVRAGRTRSSGARYVKLAPLGGRRRSPHRHGPRPEPKHPPPNPVPLTLDQQALDERRVLNLAFRLQKIVHKRPRARDFVSAQRRYSVRKGFLADLLQIPFRTGLRRPACRRQLARTVFFPREMFAYIISSSTSPTVSRE